MHVDPHQPTSVKTHMPLSFIDSRLVRYTVGAEVRQGTFLLTPDLAQRWETPDDTTDVFHLHHEVHRNSGMHSPPDGRPACKAHGNSLTSS